MKEILIPSDKKIFNFHFVCIGNTYRSRLASTELASRELEKIKVSSSGIEADKNKNGPITWYAHRIITRNKKIKYEEAQWRKTTKEILNNQDYIIFMEESIYKYCQNFLDFNSSNFEIWDIPDISDADSTDQAVIGETEKTFQSITFQVNKLSQRIKYL